MSLRYSSQQFVSNVEITTATTTTVLTVAIPPIDISHYDKFCLVYQNLNTGIAFLNLHVQASLDSSGTAANVPVNWVQVNTGTLPQPSALGATATVLTSAVDNAYKWIRVLGAVGATAGTASFLRVQIGGFLRS